MVLESCGKLDVSLSSQHSCCEQQLQQRGSLVILFSVSYIMKKLIQR